MRVSFLKRSYPVGIAVDGLLVGVSVALSGFDVGIVVVVLVRIPGMKENAASNNQSRLCASSAGFGVWGSML